MKKVYAGKWKGVYTTLKEAMIYMQLTWAEFVVP